MDSFSNLEASPSSEAKPPDIVPLLDNANEDQAPEHRKSKPPDVNTNKNHDETTTTPNNQRNSNRTEIMDNSSTTDYSDEDEDWEGVLKDITGYQGALPFAECYSGEKDDCFLAGGKEIDQFGKFVEKLSAEMIHVLPPPPLVLPKGFHGRKAKRIHEDYKEVYENVVKCPDVQSKLVEIEEMKKPECNIPLVPIPIDGKIGEFLNILMSRSKWRP
jgi:hypothetical protein